MVIPKLLAQSVSSKPFSRAGRRSSWTGRRGSRSELLRLVVPLKSSRAAQAPIRSLHQQTCGRAPTFVAVGRYPFGSDLRWNNNGGDGDLWLLLSRGFASSSSSSDDSNLDPSSDFTKDHHAKNGGLQLPPSVINEIKKENKTLSAVERLLSDRKKRRWDASDITTLLWVMDQLLQNAGAVVIGRDNKDRIDHEKRHGRMRKKKQQKDREALLHDADKVYYATFQATKVMTRWLEEIRSLNRAVGGGQSNLMKDFTKFFNGTLIAWQEVATAAVAAGRLRDSIQHERMAAPTTRAVLESRKLLHLYEDTLRHVQEKKREYVQNVLANHDNRRTTSNHDDTDDEQHQQQTRRMLEHAALDKFHERFGRFGGQGPMDKSYSIYLNTLSRYQARDSGTAQEVEDILHLQMAARHRWNQEQEKRRGNDDRATSNGRYDYDQILTGKQYHLWNVALKVLAWTSRYDPTSCERADRLFYRDMMQVYELPPTGRAYAALMDAWAKSGRGIDGAQRAEAILNDMLERRQRQAAQDRRRSSGEMNDQDDDDDNDERIWLASCDESELMQCFNTCMNAWAETHSLQGAHRAEALLKQLVHQSTSFDQEDQEGGPEQFTSPDATTVGTVIKAWAKSGAPNATEKADALFRLAQDEFRIAPTSILFGTVMDAWARAPPSSSSPTQRLERIRELMQQMEDTNDPDLQPTEVTYNILFSAMAKGDLDDFKDGRKDRGSRMVIARRAREVAERGESLLDEFEAEGRASNHMYNSVISMWSRCAKWDDTLYHDNDKTHYPPQRALNLLRQMQQRQAEAGSNATVDMTPTEIAFNAVISTFAYEGDYKGAITLLFEMESTEGVPDPDVNTYALVLHALSKSRREDSQEKATILLERMEQRGIAPNLQAYTCAIEAFSNGSKVTRESAELGEKLFWATQQQYESSSSGNTPKNSHGRQMNGTRWGSKPHTNGIKQRDPRDIIKPNNIMVGGVLRVWSRTNDPDAPERGRALIEWAELQHDDGNADMKPLLIWYNYLLLMWANSSRKETLPEMQAILKSMSTDRDSATHPDMMSYNHLMSAFLKKRQDKSVSNLLLKTLKLMIERFEGGNRKVQPNARSFNLVLGNLQGAPPHEWKTVCHDTIALIGEQLLLKDAPDAGPADVSPNNYLLLFQAARRSGFDDEVLLEQVLRQCIDSNLVNNAILRAYNSGIPQEALAMKAPPRIDQGRRNAQQQQQQLGSGSGTYSSSKALPPAQTFAKKLTHGDSSSVIDGNHEDPPEQGSQEDEFAKLSAALSSYKH